MGIHDLKLIGELDRRSLLLARDQDPAGAVCHTERMALAIAAQSDAELAKLDSAAGVRLVNFLFEARGSLATRLEVLDVALERLAAASNAGVHTIDHEGRHDHA